MTARDNFVSNEVKEKGKQMEKEWVDKIKDKITSKSVKFYETLRVKQSREKTPARTTLNTNTINTCFNSITTENSPKSKTKGISFGMYSPRKLDKDYSNNESGVLCYTNSENAPTLKYNHSYDFKKMTRRKIYKNKNPIPPICSYNPNYTSIDKNLTAVPFQIKLHKSKHSMIRKIWRSYGCDSEYKTVNFQSSIY